MPAAAGAPAEPAQAATEAATEREKKLVTIHLPPADLGEAVSENAVSENGDAPPGAPVKKKTRRGSRGGKNRRKREAAAVAPATNGSEAVEEAAPAPQDAAPEENWDYVPMSQWGDEIEG
jgi:hypothetical protein